MSNDISNDQAIADLTAALQGMVNITYDSKGVAGYHLNGEIAEWGTFPEVAQAEALLKTLNEQLAAPSPSAAEAGRWIPVGERLPEDRQVVDTIMIDGNRYTDITYRAGERWMWRYADDEGEFWEPAGEATHWMPLPEPPQ